MTKYYHTMIKGRSQQFCGKPGKAQVSPYPKASSRRQDEVGRRPSDDAPLAELSPDTSIRSLNSPPPLKGGDQ